MTSALTRYRVLAWVVGVALLLLVLVAMPLKYVGDDPSMVHLVAPLHGVLYVVYLVTAVDLGLRMRWPITRTVVILLAGTIPFLSFVTERWVTEQARAAA